MEIPNYEKILLPLLEITSDQKEHDMSDVVVRISEHFNLSEEQKRELLPSGKQQRINNRIGWARTHLKKAGLIESTKRGYYKITDRGLNVLKQKPKEINNKYLERFQEFKEFITIKKPETELEPSYSQTQVSLKSGTPKEIIENHIEVLKNNLVDDILNKIKERPFGFFERLVVDLLLNMGYGGSREDAGKVIGTTGDEGIDGTINQDKLGLDTIYIQAKRWYGKNVGRPEIQKFVGALNMKGAKKGVFITTSNFTQDAEASAKEGFKDPKIVLIDGRKLANFMIENDIGVSKESTYYVKRIDEDYFEAID